MTTRRDFLAAGLGAGLLAAPARAAARKRVLRLAHVTDTHVQPELRAAEGFAAALRHLQAQRDPAELVLLGGDCVMDALQADRDRTRLQWDLFTRILKAECSLPVEACIGNHDIWGWVKAKSKAAGTEPEFGKRWALDALGLSRRYRSFDRAGWRFIALDSVQPADNKYGFAAFLDGEQFAWLALELARTPAATPVLVMSHCPIVSTLPLMLKRDTPTADLVTGPGYVHTDSAVLVGLFSKFPNVKLCVSGHLHSNERVDLLGVTHMTNGAVSGNWWKGRHHFFDEGYALIDLYDDGTFEGRYETYGWKAAKE